MLFTHSKMRNGGYWWEVGGSGWVPERGAWLDGTGSWGDDFWPFCLMGRRDNKNIPPSWIALSPVISGIYCCWHSINKFLLTPPHSWPLTHPARPQPFNLVTLLRQPAPVVKFCISVVFMIFSIPTHHLNLIILSAFNKPPSANVFPNWYLMVKNCAPDEMLPNFCLSQGFSRA